MINGKLSVHLSETLYPLGTRLLSCSKTKTLLSFGNIIWTKVEYSTIFQRCYQRQTFTLICGLTIFTNKLNEEQSLKYFYDQRLLLLYQNLKIIFKFYCFNVCFIYEDK